MNGLISLVDFGLANVDDGFGPYIDKPPDIGDYSTSVGILTFPYQTDDTISASDKIDELSTMMTAGRLSAENKQVILVRFYQHNSLFLRPTRALYLRHVHNNLQDAHAYFRANHGVDFADRIILKLMAATPEFHTSNTGMLVWVTSRNTFNSNDLITFSLSPNFCVTLLNISA
jgi:hypothetical protein